MKGRLVLMATLMGASLTAPARQLWLAPGGTGNGLTEASPAGDALVAIESLVAGDTLWLKAGTYDVNNMIVARRSGTRHHRICVFGCGDNRAVLDFSSAPHICSRRAGTRRRSQWHLVPECPGASKV